MPPDGNTLLFRAIPAHLRLNPEEKRALKQFTAQLSDRVTGGRTFCCLFSNDEELQRLNRTFLEHDYPTDVLSFPEPSGSDSAGDLAISVERAHSQAEEFGHSLFDELRILLLHGALHLSGMDHEADRGEMARAERKLRAEFGLPNSLIARTK